MIASCWHGVQRICSYNPEPDFFTVCGRFYDGGMLRHVEYDNEPHASFQSSLFHHTCEHYGTLCVSGLQWCALS